MPAPPCPVTGCRDLTLAPFFGNSVACRLSEAHEIKHGTLVLGDWRAAQRIEFSLGGEAEAGSSGSGQQQEKGSGGEPMKVWVCNTHLDHDHTDNRHRQAVAVCRWMDGCRRNGAAAVVLCGDFNGPPEEEFHQFLERDGYRSAYKDLHGREPEVRVTLEGVEERSSRPGAPRGFAESPVDRALALHAGHLADRHPGPLDGPRQV